MMMMSERLRCCQRRPRLRLMLPRVATPAFFRAYGAAAVERSSPHDDDYAIRAALLV